MTRCSTSWPGHTRLAASRRRRSSALNRISEGYPETALVDEVEFRRGEILFLNKDYNNAEMAYKAVVEYGPESKFYEQSLYKLGWSQFKLAWYDDSLGIVFHAARSQDRQHRTAGWVRTGSPRLSRAEQELVEDTFRVLSISFSYMDGAESIDEFLDDRGHPHYAYIIYMNLGDLYLGKDRIIDAAETYEAFVEQDPYHPKAPLLQVEVIEAYKQGGFPDLVLDGKKGFRGSLRHGRRLLGAQSA